MREPALMFNARTGIEGVVANDAAGVAQPRENISVPVVMRLPMR